MQDVFIIVGLGNPSKEHEKTRHNVGFRVVDALCKDLEFDKFKLDKKFDAEVCEGLFGDKKVLIVKPQTFMNLSGEAVQKLVSFYKIPLDHLILVYDDIDLPFSSVRFRDKGGPGTHNGMRSVISSLGSENFKRIRIGTESRSLELIKKQDLSDFVLSRFTKDEEKLLDKIVLEAISVIKDLLSE